MSAGHKLPRQKPPWKPEEQPQDTITQVPVDEGPPTSRLCIKNIPKYLQEQRLKDHFSAKGQVTDVKILKTRDGQPRQMAFVGYRTVEDAAAALRYFNNTFIDTCRLSIEYARRFKAADSAAASPDPQVPVDAHRPWSKHSAGSSKHIHLLAKQQAAAHAQASLDMTAKASSAFKGSKRGKAADVVDEAAAVDPQLAEFLQLMQPRVKAKIWGNDELLPQKAGTTTAAAIPGGGTQKSLQAAGNTKGLAEEDDEPSSAAEQSDDDVTDPLAVKDAVVIDEGLSDMDYLRARMRKAPAAVAAKTDDSEGAECSSSSSDDDSDAGLQAGGPHASTSGSSGSGLHHDNDSDVESDGDVPEPGRQQQQVRSRQQQMRSSSRVIAEDDEDEQQQQQNQDNPGSEPGTDDSLREPDYAQQQQHGLGGGASEEAVAAEASIRESGRLFVRNLAYTAGQLELSELFGQYGDIEEVHLVLDRDTRKSKGIAYIKYLVPEDAVAAYRALDMTPFQGRLLHVLPAKQKPGEVAGTQQQQQEEQGQPGFRAERDAQRKRDAGNRSAWSTLFMRTDTVAAAVAAHYGVSKAQLLDAAADDLPLRMALGEAQVIAQTKAALADAGLNTKALEAAAAASGAAAATESVARSSTSLLVKNLPYTADDDELQQLFVGPGRSVVRLVLPPTKTLAVVEFSEPQDARAAFKALAYKKYQQVPLYLEWAPVGIWDTPPPAAPAATSPSSPRPPAGVKVHSKPLNDAAAAAQCLEDADDTEQGPVVSIYVKNLNFATTDASLKSHFDSAISAAGGQIHSAKVARRKGTDGKLLSMGYGFVETDSVAVAQAVVKQLQGSMLDKHKLTLQLSKRHRTKDSNDSTANQKAKEGAAKGTKLIVRNVAFEATKRDISGLFGPFGHIKSCRLPKKFDGNHRGFAFLEFTTKQEARNALEGVSGTHLYGRRLVVEYAQADVDGLAATGEPLDLQQARVKTAVKFLGSQEVMGDEGEAAAAPARKRLRRNL